MGEKIGYHLCRFVIFYLIAFPIYSGKLFFLVAAEERPIIPERYFLPASHRLNRPLNKLCKDPSLFDSRENLEKCGFHVKKRMHRELMVISRPEIEGYLIKKFRPTVSSEKQLINYLNRIEGAEKLREFIRAKKLQGLVVPKKWLYRLKRFKGRNSNESEYILIVEKIDICGGEKDPNGETGKKYGSISRSLLRELCIVLYRFRGLDSVLTNLPFTRRNRIAFIDTEKWAEPREGFLTRVLPYLSPSDRQYVERMRLELEKGEE